MPRTAQFKASDFGLAEDPPTLTCPAGETLRLIGEYAYDGDGAYRLFGRSDCGDCPMKARCTTGRGRRVKLPLTPPAPQSLQAPPPPPVEEPRPQDRKEYGQPVASVTEPEALFMLATSTKHWQPSYNADITVTRDQLVVSQFLTNHPTDYHGFEVALAFVSDHLGKPKEWVGDGHYGTESNVAAAHQAGVLLFAKRAGGDRTREDGVDGATHAVQRARSGTVLFSRADFVKAADRDAYVCPDGRDLTFIGEYPTDNLRSTYRLYGRRACDGCALKERCTTVAGRRIKVPSTPQPVRSRAPPDAAPAGADGALAAFTQRMEADQGKHSRLRGGTVEPVNAQLKQHGLGRFHVRGLARCGAVLTLGCIAHNLMKWNARLLAQNLSMAAK